MKKNKRNKKFSPRAVLPQDANLMARLNFYKNYSI